MGIIKRGALKCSALALIAGVAVGCGVEIEGDEGNLTFNYIDKDFRSAPSNGVIAVGASVDVEVKDARDDKAGDVALELIDAYSDDAQTLDVAGVDEYQFTLRAGAESGAEGTTIHAEAVGEDGEELSDSAGVETREATEVEVESYCDPAMYVTDSEAWFNYTMRQASGSRVTGYGYYPLVLDDDAGEINEDHDVIQTMSVHTGSEPGSYEIAPDEEEIGGSAFEFELVAPEEIEHLELEFDHEDTESTVEVGDTEVVAWFAVGAHGENICPGIEGALQLESNTPDVCEVSYTFLGNLHFVQADGLEAGQCEFELGIVDTDLEETVAFDVE